MAGRTKSRGIRYTGVVSAVPKESEDQAAYFEWLKTVRVAVPSLDGGRTRPLYDFAFAVPNGSMLAGDSKQRARYMAFLKKQGLKPGVSDIVIPYPVGTYHGLFVEMKRVKGGAITQAQQDWQALLLSAGYWAVIACGLDAAKSTTLNYLSADKS